MHYTYHHWGQVCPGCILDGSDEVFVTLIYAVWLAPETEEPMEVRLVASKTRVAANWEKNTVRQELNKAVD